MTIKPFDENIEDANEAGVQFCLALIRFELIESH